MDYCELHSQVERNPSQDTAVCHQKLCEWRKRATAVPEMDLKKAYPQVRVSRDLQNSQTMHKVQRSTLWYGQNRVECCAQNNAGTHQCDIVPGCWHRERDWSLHRWANKSVRQVEKVKQTLLKYGLVTKDPGALRNTHVLGLKMKDFGDEKFV